MRKLQYNVRSSDFRRFRSGSSEPEAAAGLENDASSEDAFQTGLAHSHSNIPELPMTDNSALRPDALTPKEITEKVLGLGVA